MLQEGQYEKDASSQTSLLSLFSLPSFPPLPLPPSLTSPLGTKLASKSRHISAATRSSQINSCSSNSGPSGMAVRLNGCRGGPGWWPPPPDIGQGNRGREGRGGESCTFGSRHPIHSPPAPSRPPLPELVFSLDYTCISLPCLPSLPPFLPALPSTPNPPSTAAERVKFLMTSWDGRRAKAAPPALLTRTEREDAMVSLSPVGGCVCRLDKEGSERAL